MIAQYHASVSHEVEPAEAWDELVSVCTAPFMYRAAALRSYERTPLQHPSKPYYVRIFEGRELAAVFPLFVLPPEDPLGVLAIARRGGRVDPDAPIVVSHVWHWYDTRIPARTVSEPLVAAIKEVVVEVARAEGAQLAGFINLARTDPFLPLLEAAGFTVTRVDSRYQLGLGHFQAPCDWLGTLRGSARQDMRRQLRKAAAGGWVVTAAQPTPESARRAAQLCRRTGVKHGNPDWYDQGALTGLILSLADQVLLVNIEREGEVVASSVSLVDGPVFHNWAAGTAADGVVCFSPYQVLLHHTVEAALARSCTLLEGGRRNDAWKLRFGFDRLDLHAALIDATLVRS